MNGAHRAATQEDPMRTTLAFAAAFSLLFALSGTEADAAQTSKKKVLVHSAAGSDDPTRANLALIGAFGVAEAGHDVSVVLSGEATYLLSDQVAAATVGVGLGDAKGWFAKLKKHNVPVYYCGGCGKARGVGDFKAKSVKATGITAKQFGQMVADFDRVVSY
jgi:sulfur relay (sulfurtransferase) complex TusBCD TusD component (DsrE family)